MLDDTTFFKKTNPKESIHEPTRAPQPQIKPDPTLAAKTWNATVWCKFKYEVVPTITYQEPGSLKAVLAYEFPRPSLVVISNPWKKP